MHSHCNHLFLSGRSYSKATCELCAATGVDRNSSISSSEIVHLLSVFIVWQNFMIDPIWLMSSWPELASIPRIVIFHGKHDIDDSEMRHLLPAHAELHYRSPPDHKFTHPVTGMTPKTECQY
jgi:hypothetical protein